MRPIFYGLLFLALAPIFGGLVAGADRIVTARMQSRVGPPLLQPFYDAGKLFSKTSRQINPVQEPLLLGHVTMMAVTGAMLLLVLAAGSASSPYSFTGAERELIVLLAVEPFFILMMAAICKVTDASTYGGVLASPKLVALEIPGVLVTFLLVAVVKLRKSPFDISISHHPHQELVKGLTTDMSGRLLAYVEIAHWYETALLAAFTVLFFNWNVGLGLVAFAIGYLTEVLVDNSTSRIKWQLLLRFTWTVTLLFCAGNVLALFVLGV
jgi:ech hydrogenase subunit B